MRTLFTFALIALLYSSPLFSQTPGWIWAQTVTGNSFSGGKSICTDHDGNIIVTGTFGTDSISFGNKTFVDTSPSYPDLFIVKYDRAGNVLWAKTASGIYRMFANAVCTDAQNNIIVAGYFQSPTITFGSWTLNNSTPGSDDIFVVKFDADGNALWAKSAGYYDNDRAAAVCADWQGNIFVTGYFYEHINFGNIQVTNSDTINPSPDIFLVKYDSTGNEIWAKGIGGRYNSGENANTVAVDGTGNVIIAGEFWGFEIIFDTDTLLNSHTIDPTSDIFLAKYNSTGNLVWAKSGTGDFIDKGNSVTTDLNGNVLLTGSYDGYNLSFDTLTLINSQGPSLTEIGFVAKFDSLGNALWMMNTGIFFGSGNGVCPDANNNVIVTGEEAGNLFVTKYDTAGGEIWTKSAYGYSSSGSAVSVDPSGAILVTGSFGSFQCLLDSFLLVNSSSGWNRYLIARLDECVFSSDSMVSQQCDSAEINSIVYHDSGIYNQLLVNAAGCDSLLTIDLTINHLDISTSVADSIISANQSGASYQWLDCNNAYAIIPSETSQTFTATSNGDYAVAMTFGGCADTSECVSMLNLTSNSISNFPITISPNPATDKIILRNTFGSVNQDIAIYIYDASGEKVFSTNVSGKEEISVRKLNAGTYIVVAIYRGKSFTQKLIVQN